MALTKPQQAQVNPDIEDDDSFVPLPRAGGGSELDEYKAGYGKTIIAGYARIDC